jgi:hypothetical protein
MILKFLIIDYCKDKLKIDDSYLLNYEKGFFSLQRLKENFNMYSDYPLLPFKENNLGYNKFKRG